MTLRGFLLSLRRIVLAIAAILAIVCATGAWIVRGPLVGRTDVRPVGADVSTERLRSTVETLSTRFRTRWITHPETLAAAADWIGERMRAAGLEVTDHPFD